jgi:hypothetical protein
MKKRRDLHEVRTGGGDEVDGFHDGIPIKKREKRKKGYRLWAMGYGKKRKIKKGGGRWAWGKELAIAPPSRLQGDLDPNHLGLNSLF